MKQELNFLRKEMLLLSVTLLLSLAAMPGQVTSFSGTYLPRYLQGLIKGRYLGGSKYNGDTAELRRVSKVIMINYKTRVKSVQ